MKEYRLEIIERDKANLLSLILEAVLKRAVNDITKLKNLKRARGTYLIRASKMKCYLIIGDEGAKIKNYEGEDYDCYVEGGIFAFFKIARGSLSPLPILKREIKVKGNIFKIINLGMLLRR